VINIRGLTAHYSAPESFRKFRAKNYNGVDFKKYDIYSLACVAFEVLLQKGPWD
jgi:serine/threonine protein kinase